MAYKKVTIIQGKSGRLEIDGEGAYEQVDRQMRSKQRDIYVYENKGNINTERIFRASDIKEYYVKETSY